MLDVSTDMEDNIEHVEEKLNLFSVVLQKFEFYDLDKLFQLLNFSL